MQTFHRSSTLKCWFGRAISKSSCHSPNSLPILHTANYDNNQLTEQLTETNKVDQNPLITVFKCDLFTHGAK